MIADRPARQKSSLRTILTSAIVRKLFFCPEMQNATWKKVSPYKNARCYLQSKKLPPRSIFCYLYGELPAPRSILATCRKVSPYKNARCYLQNKKLPPRSIFCYLYGELLAPRSILATWRKVSPYKNTRCYLQSRRPSPSMPVATYSTDCCLQEHLFRKSEIKKNFYVHLFQTDLYEPVF